MTTSTEFPSTLVTGFLRAMAFEIEEDGELLWARRRSAGHIHTAAYCATRNLEGDSVSSATRTLSRALRLDPGAALHSIYLGQSPIPDDLAQRFTDIGASLTTEAGYLNRVVQSARLCESFQQEANAYVPEETYVEPRVSPGNRQAMDALLEWTRTADVSLMVLLGHAGYGKTCLANHLVRRLAQRHLRNENEPIPFLFPLHRHRHVRRFEELVLTHLEDRGVYGFTSEGFAYLIDKGRVIPVLDGFDELAETGGLGVARETLKGLIHRISTDAKVLLTSRQAYFRHRGDLSLVGSDDELCNLHTTELEPFDEEQRRQFLQKRGLHRDQIGQIESHVKSIGSEDVLGSPLMLKIVADEVKVGGRELGSNGAEVFHESIKRVCEREVPKGKFRWSPELQVRFLNDVATLMYEENSYELGVGWLDEIVASDVPAETKAGKKLEELAARVQQLVNHPLLVGFVGKEGDAIRFPHPLYRDFLLACECVSKLANDSVIRRTLQGGVPDATATFLGDLLSDEDVARLFKRCEQWRENSRPLWVCALKKCNRGQDVKERTQILLSCLGSRRSFDYQNLAGLRVFRVTLQGFSFVSTDLRDSTFHSCVFGECDFNGARVRGARFYDCTADERTAKCLEGVGVPLGEVTKRLMRGATVEVQNADPVVQLVKRFFERFIRKELGKHQATTAAHSFFSGLGGEERKFTEREIIPEMRKVGVIEERRISGGGSVYHFNSAWQPEGDAIVGGAQVTGKLVPLVTLLREKAGRYSIV